MISGQDTSISNSCRETITKELKRIYAEDGKRLLKFEPRKSIILGAKLASHYSNDSTFRKCEVINQATKINPTLKSYSRDNLEHYVDDCVKRRIFEIARVEYRRDSNDKEIREPRGEIRYYRFTDRLKIEKANHSTIERPLHSSPLDGFYVSVSLYVRDHSVINIASPNFASTLKTDAGNMLSHLFDLSRRATSHHHKTRLENIQKDLFQLQDIYDRYFKTGTLPEDELDVFKHFYEEVQTFFKEAHSGPDFSYGSATSNSSFCHPQNRGEVLED